MLEISYIHKHPTKVLPTILKVTEDGGLTFETLEFLCEVVS